MSAILSAIYAALNGLLTFGPLVQFVTWVAGLIGSSVVWVWAALYTFIVASLGALLGQIIGFCGKIVFCTFVWPFKKLGSFLITFVQRKRGA